VLPSDSIYINFLPDAKKLKAGIFQGGAIVYDNASRQILEKTLYILRQKTSPYLDTLEFNIGNLKCEGEIGRFIDSQTSFILQNGEMHKGTDHQVVRGGGFTAAKSHAPASGQNNA
jgi:hypothetical protein